jgi:hypothetical protein
MRKLALLLAAAILPACDLRTAEDNVRISVQNQGTTESARVDFQVERSGDSTIDGDEIVAPGASILFVYDNVTRVAVQVYRTSDNLKLFDDFWRADDLRKQGDQVSVTVSP